MSQVYDLDVQVMCNRAGLDKDQKRFCEEYPDIAISIGKGARLGVQECQKQLKEELWNCSTVARDVSVFGKVPRKGKRISYSRVSESELSRGITYHHPITRTGKPDKRKFAR